MSESHEGHRVLTIQFDDEELSAGHQLFFRQYRSSGTNSKYPQFRTLVVLNVPPWMDEDGLSRIFKPNGPIDEVHTEPAPRKKMNVGQPLKGGFKVAHVVFSSAAGLQNAMRKMNVSKPFVLNPKNESSKHSLIGIVKWRQEYNDSLRLDVESMASQIEAAVKEIDRKKTEEIKKAEEEAVEDEEGWVTVSRHTHAKRKPVGNATKSGQKKILAKEAKKRKRKELEHFYKFQLKESKLQRLSELKEKFQKDKEKQASMKQERKFKPV